MPKAVVCRELGPPERLTLEEYAMAMRLLMERKAIGRVALVTS